MKHSFYTLLAMLLICHKTQSQEWIPQGEGLLPFGYSITGISVADDTVIWVNASLIENNSYPVHVFRSADAGQSWEMFKLTSCSGCKSRHMKAIGASTAWLTTYDQMGVGRLYKTVDGGQHWILKLLDSAAAGHIQVYDQDHMTCQSGPNIAWSDDGGENWETGILTDNLPTLNPHSDGPDRPYGDTAWFGMSGDMYFSAENISARLMRTSGYGHEISYINCKLDSIASIGLISFRDYRHGIMKYTKWAEGFDPDLLHYGYVYSDTDDLALSADGGESWVRIPAPISKIHDIMAIPGAVHTFLVTGEKQIAITRNDGESWQNEILPYAVSGIDFSSIHTGWVGVNGTSYEDPLVLKWNGDFITSMPDDSEMSPGVITVVPNPAAEWISFTFGDDISQVFSLLLTDVTGQIVLTKETIERDLILAGLPPGIYFLQITLARKIYLARIVKQ